MDNFPLMHEIVPPGEVGEAKLNHVELTEKDLIFHNMRASLRRGDRISPGKYARLFVAGKLMMSDTDMERRSHLFPLNAAKGRCLVGGFGLGMVVCGLALKETVTEIVVLEKSKDVIALIGPHVEKFVKEHGKQIQIINADVFTWKLPKEKFDLIWMDIWPDISVENLPEIATLNRRFARIKAHDGTRGTWMEDRLRSLQRQEKRNAWY